MFLTDPSALTRNVCCLGVVREYFGRRRKYNLVELLKTEADTEPSAEKKEVEGGEVAGESPPETESKEEGMKVEDNGANIVVADSVTVEVKAEEVKTEEVKTDQVKAEDVPQETIDKK